MFLVEFLQSEPGKYKQFFVAYHILLKHTLHNEIPITNWSITEFCRYYGQCAYGNEISCTSPLEILDWRISHKVSPLNADGSNFPCKRYPKGPLRTTLTAGSTSDGLTGPRMIVANLPGYPSIPEFPPSIYDGINSQLA
jgi:hypothetical protein